MKIRNIIILCSVLSANLSLAEEVPKDLLEGLASEQFKRREESQAAIEKWVNEKGTAAVAAIHKLYVATDDPEVRSRCLRVLRIQSDIDYLKDGIGYLGVGLDEISINLPGEEKPRIAILIVSIGTGSQAKAAGLKVGDVITSMDGKKWDKQGGMYDFMNTIASYKPMRKVVFEVKRQGEEKLLDITVTLGKRPLENLNAMDLNLHEQVDKEARDKHLAEWLKKQKFE
jgi:C-terminal processing protease CtpA/Prc